MSPTAAIAASEPLEVGAILHDEHDSVRGAAAIVAAEPDAVLEQIEQTQTPPTLADQAVPSPPNALRSDGVNPFAEELISAGEEIRRAPRPRERSVASEQADEMPPTRAVTEEVFVKPRSKSAALPPDSIQGVLGYASKSIAAETSKVLVAVPSAMDASVRSLTQAGPANSSAAAEPTLAWFNFQDWWSLLISWFQGLFATSLQTYE